MERHFVLPLTIAAALHAGLLLGIRGGPAHAKAPDAKIVPGDFWPIPIDIISIPPPEPDASSSGGVATDPPPTLPERPLPETRADFKVDVPPRVPIPIHEMQKIPEGPIGIPGDIRDGGPPGTGSVVPATLLDSMPRTRFQAAPIYPFEAKRDGRSGEVVVEFTVDESGAVLAPRVVKSSDPLFDEATLRAVARWRFEPGRRDGRVVRFRMVVPVIYNLENN